MDTVTVSKTELITKLKANRESHSQLFKDALEGYFVEVAKKLDAARAKIKAGKTIQHLNFPVPVDHTKQYDEALVMLEMSVDDEIELRRAEFNNYILDQWISIDEKNLLRGMALSSSNSAMYAGLDD